MGSNVASPRYRIKNTDESTQVTIFAKKGNIDLGFSILMSFLWFMGELLFLGLLIYLVGGFLTMALGVNLFWYDKSRDGFIDVFLGIMTIAWLVLWTATGLGSTLTLLWQLAGKEVLEVSQTGIQWSRKLLGLGKTKQYQAGEISDLRLLADSERTKNSQNVESNVLGFDYKFNTVQFGEGLADEEANAILAVIMKNYQKYAPKSGE